MTNEKVMRNWEENETNGKKVANEVRIKRGKNYEETDL